MASSAHTGGAQPGRVTGTGSYAIPRHTGASGPRATNALVTEANGRGVCPVPRVRSAHLCRITTPTQQQGPPRGGEPRCAIPPAVPRGSAPRRADQSSATYPPARRKSTRARPARCSTGSYAGARRATSTTNTGTTCPSLVLDGVILGLHRPGRPSPPWCSSAARASPSGVIHRCPARRTGPGGDRRPRRRARERRIAPPRRPGRACRRPPGAARPPVTATRTPFTPGWRRCSTCRGAPWTEFSLAVAAVVVERGRCSPG